MKPALLVVLALAALPARLDAIGCQDGSTRKCKIGGKPGTQECIGQVWSKCLPDDPGPAPSPTPPPDGPVAAPAQEVTAEALPLAIDQTTAFSDCCITCGEQTLEALIPTPEGPRLRQPGEPMPPRQTLCGRVTKYEVNDEVADPRDICINLRPLDIAPFPDFVAGFVKTAAGFATVGDFQRFGNQTCPAAACRARAKQILAKIVHAEVTPDEHFYGQDARFLPIAASGRCSDSDETCDSELEPSRGAKDVCVHGVYAYDHGDVHGTGLHDLCCVMDTGHDHPEIHPFDAIWWKDPRRNGWVFGVFQDDSNRYSFPHCGDSNDNAWSQAPRDVTFTFPFKFKRSAGCQVLHLRHVRTTNMKGQPNTVRPMNVTRSERAVGPEVLILTADEPAFRPLLEVRKEAGSGRETHVRVVGGVNGPDVQGQVILSVAVGSGRPGADIFNELKNVNRLVTYDARDAGAGFYYAELFFEGKCGPIALP
jgi:hypothetical protein